MKIDCFDILILYKRCPYCCGTGKQLEDNLKECPYCNGRGYLCAERITVKELFEFFRKELKKILEE